MGSPAESRSRPHCAPKILHRLDARPSMDCAIAVPARLGWPYFATAKIEIATSGCSSPHRLIGGCDRREVLIHVANVCQARGGDVVADPRTS